MAFSAIFQFLPGDEPGMSRWLLEHYLEHQQFYRELLAQTPSVRTVNLPIQRIDNWPDWLAAHQAMSQSVWTGLGGGQSLDFGRLNYEDSNAVQDWLQTHAGWHATVRNDLGL